MPKKLKILFDSDIFNRQKYGGISWYITEIIKGLQKKADITLPVILSENLYLKEKKLGDISIKRDFGFAPKYVEVMHLMLQQKEPSDYLICLGQSISLKEIIDYVFDKIGVSKTKYHTNPDLLRTAKILNIYGDNSKAKKELNWDYNLNFFEVLDILIAEELTNDLN